MLHPELEALAEFWDHKSRLLANVIGGYAQMLADPTADYSTEKLPARRPDPHRPMRADPAPHRSLRSLGTGPAI